MAQTPILTDSFTDTDTTVLQSHTADTGQAWTKIGTIDATIESNVLQCGPSFDWTNEPFVPATDFIAYSAPVAFGSNAQFAQVRITDYTYEFRVSLMLRTNGTHFVECRIFADVDDNCQVNFYDSNGTVNETFNLGDGYGSLVGSDLLFKIADDHYCRAYIDGELICVSTLPTDVVAIGDRFILRQDVSFEFVDITQKFDLLSVGTFNSDPPADPTLLTGDCSSGIGETILPGAPVAAFSADVYAGTAPLTVNFTDLSSGTPTSWLWEFGDGVTSTSQNPGHAFATGTYLVRLTATNDYGSSSYEMTIISTGVLIGGSVDSILGRIAYYIVDTNNNVIKIYGIDGSLLKTFGGLGSALGKYFMPTTCSIINGRQLLDRITINQG